ncbi:MAG: complement resistance protein TraT, partial [Caldimicrobium sp.]|nr:complement resistance protein TraT [Caldimicrobium sp.]
VMLKGVWAKILAVLLIFQLSGCAIIPEAIEHRDLRVGLKMTDTIFLEPTKKAQNRDLYVEVRNTSELQEVSTDLVKNLLVSRLKNKGYRITDDPTKAGYILQINILYMDYYRKTGAKEGALTGAAVGGLAGAMAGGRDLDALILAAAGAALGYVGGAIIGSAIKIETFAGVIDVQIQERTDKPVVGELRTEAKQGTATTLITRQEVQTQYQTYRTRIAATAIKTNLKREEAAPVIAEKLAVQVSEIF